MKFIRVNSSPNVRPTTLEDLHQALTGINRKLNILIDGLFPEGELVNNNGNLKNFVVTDDDEEDEVELVETSGINESIKITSKRINGNLLLLPHSFLFHF